MNKRVSICIKAAFFYIFESQIYPVFLHFRNRGRRHVYFTVGTDASRVRDGCKGQDWYDDAYQRCRHYNHLPHEHIGLCLWGHFNFQERQKLLCIYW